jgi:hypothetical protein
MMRERALVDTEKPMPVYDIIYFDPDGRVSSKVKAECADDREAKILAHALKEKGRKRIKVWSGDTEIYQRPLTASVFPLPG